MDAARRSRVIQDDDSMRMPDLGPIACLQAINARLNDASAMTQAALTCAEAGSERRALGIILDLDILLHEATTLHGALRLMGRLQPETTGSEPAG